MKAANMDQNYWKGWDVIGSILGWSIGTAVFALACFVQFMYYTDISSGHTRLDFGMYVTLIAWAMPILVYCTFMVAKFRRVFGK